MFPKEFHEIVNSLNCQGGKCLVVGGAVRDIVSGCEPKDIDIEVYGLEASAIIDCLSRFGKVDCVGASFGVIKLTAPENDYDFNIPRRESKNGQGNKGFIPLPDPTMTPREAAERRDFTWNAMFCDPKTGEITDLFGGIDDFNNRLLQHTTVRFAEDPLRVLRGFQFAGRYNMTVSPETSLLCNQLQAEYSALPVERIWVEWQKWAEKSIVPSVGLKFLVDVDWIKLYPELFAMIGVEQEPEWHPCGDCYRHSGHVVDEMADICQRESITGNDRSVLMFAALCHDMGKPSTTAFIDGRIRSPGHEKAGELPTRSFLKRIGCPTELVERIVPLVMNHLAHMNTFTEKAARRLAVRLGKATIRELVYVIEADSSGRPPLPKSCPEEASNMLALAESVGVTAGQPVPFLMGRHLIELGMKPGPMFTTILRAVYDAQLEGTVTCLQDARQLATEIA